MAEKVFLPLWRKSMAKMAKNLRHFRHNGENGRKCSAIMAKMARKLMAKNFFAIFAMAKIEDKNNKWRWPPPNYDRTYLLHSIEWGEHPSRSSTFDDILTSVHLTVKILGWSQRVYNSTYTHVYMCALHMDTYTPTPPHTHPTSTTPTHGWKDGRVDGNTDRQADKKTNRRNPP